MVSKRDIQLTVITPERQVLDDTTASVVLPAHDGELGILLDRAPLMCELGIGQLRYQKAGGVRRFFIDGGFAQVLNNRVTVLTPRALAADEVSAATVRDFERAAAESGGTSAQAREARERAQRRARVIRALAGRRGPGEE